MTSWQQVTALFREGRYAVEQTEHFLGIWRMGIDTGGNKLNDTDITMTQQVYLWLREQDSINCFGVKGSSTTHATGNRVSLSRVDRMPGYSATEIIPGGVSLALVDTNSFKDAIQYHLALPEGHPARLTFHSETDDNFIKQLLSEEKQKIGGKRGEVKYVWVQKSSHNHYLDCLTYAYALADQECLGGVRILRPPWAY